MKYLPDWLRRQRAQYLVNRGRVKTQDAARLGRTIDSGHLECPFYAVGGVFIAGRLPLVTRTFDPPFDIVDQSIDYPGRRGLIKRFLREDLRPELARSLGRTMLLGPSFYDTFWHWMFEGLLKALLAEECGFTGVYLVPAHAYARRSLLHVGIAPERIVTYDNGVWHADELWVSPHLRGEQLLHHLDLLQKLRSAMLRDVRPAGARRRLYVSRNRPGVARPILNEPDFKALIARFGFEEYFCEDHDIADQVSDFARCEAIIGSDGAGIAVNALYMPLGSLVVSLFSPMRFWIGGTLLPVKLLRQRYYPIMPYVAGPYPHGEDVIANLDMIEATLEREVGVASNVGEP